MAYKAQKQPSISMIYAIRAQEKFLKTEGSMTKAMTWWVKVLSTNPDNLHSSLRPTWRKERTNSGRLSYGLNTTYTHLCTYTVKFKKKKQQNKTGGTYGELSIFNFLKFCQVSTQNPHNFHLPFYFLGKYICFLIKLIFKWYNT